MHLSKIQKREGQFSGIFYIEGDAIQADAKAPFLKRSYCSIHIIYFDRPAGLLIKNFYHKV